mmetsp:Transcript_22835/g.19115  ORF Transcript_22835/g.19115 Transcript_22835/m.19115 type:complete len:202 (+) Transcript_22835:48-653(+)
MALGPCCWSASRNLSCSSCSQYLRGCSLSDSDVRRSPLSSPFFLSKRVLTTSRSLSNSASDSIRRRLRCSCSTARCCSFSESSSFSMLLSPVLPTLAVADALLPFELLWSELRADFELLFELLAVPVELLLEPLWLECVLPQLLPPRLFPLLLHDPCDVLPSLPLPPADALAVSASSNDAPAACPVSSCSTLPAWTHPPAG